VGVGQDGDAVGEQAAQVRRFQWWALALGIAAGLVYGVWESVTADPMRPTPFRMFANLCYWLSRLFVMAFYVATIVRAANNPVWRVRLAPIAMAGRMPLTNYLLQTLLATSLFYGWGLGLWGKTGPAANIGIAVTIFFVIQVPLSVVWLKRFELGPMEYVWRLLTYGHASLRRKPAMSEAAA
jgi:uncharacterized protein